MGNFKMVSFIIVLLYIWFDTDAFIEYAEALHLKFFKYEQYKQGTERYFTQGMRPPSYPDWLASVNKRFLIKLITCPICLSVWLNMLFVCVFYRWTGFRFLALDILATWIGYFGVRRLIVRWNA